MVTDIIRVTFRKEIVTKEYSALVWTASAIPFLGSERNSDIKIINEQKQGHVMVPLR